MKLFTKYIIVVVLGSLERYIARLLKCEYIDILRLCEFIDDLYYLPIVPMSVRSSSRLCTSKCFEYNDVTGVGGRMTEVAGPGCSTHLTSHLTNGWRVYDLRIHL